MDVNSLIQSLKDPAIVQSMPIGDKLMAGLYVTFMGMTITFIGLIFLWGAIELMSKLIGTKKPTDLKVVAAANPAQPQAVLAPAAAGSGDIDDELIAVITAAVAASLKTSIHNVVVRNIVRVADDTPAWARAGRVDQINNRF